MVGVVAEGARPDQDTVGGAAEQGHQEAVGGAVEADRHGALPSALAEGGDPIGGGDEVRHQARGAEPNPERTAVQAEERIVRRWALLVEGNLEPVGLGEASQGLGGHPGGAAKGRGRRVFTQLG